jgi:hypothetical protein
MTTPTDHTTALCCCSLPAGHLETEKAPFCLREAYEKLIALATDTQLRLTVLESTLSASKEPAPLFSEIVQSFPPLGATGGKKRTAATSAESAPERTVATFPSGSAHQPAPSQTAPKIRISKRSRPTLHEIDGDLFVDAPPSAALAHCVGSDFKMGAGLAVEFKKRFGEQELLRDLHLRPGSVAKRPQRDRHTGQLQRYVFHLVTKPKSANCLPRPPEFRCAVRAMARECVRLKIDTVAMPKIGAGLDRQLGAGLDASSWKNLPALVSTSSSS